MEPGLQVIKDRHGRDMEVLASDDGTRSAAEGRDLAGVAKGLTLPQLDRWVTIFRDRSMTYEAAILQKEIDCRDPHGARGTLWQFMYPAKE